MNAHLPSSSENLPFYIFDSKGNKYTTIAYSYRYHGLMFGTAKIRFCDSLDEGMYPTEASAQKAIQFVCDMYGVVKIAPHPAIEEGLL
jgi:hypothetical protein